MTHASIQRSFTDSLAHSCSSQLLLRTSLKQVQPYASASQSTMTLIEADVGHETGAEVNGQHDQGFAYPSYSYGLHYPANVP